MRLKFEASPKHHLNPAPTFVEGNHSGNAASSLRYIAGRARVCLLWDGLALHPVHQDLPILL